MGRKTAKTFSLAEANALIPSVADLTAEVVRQLEDIRQEDGWAKNPEAAMPEGAMQQIQETLANWSRSIRELGAQPKGYFTVDFPSPDPELLYCWTYGEEQIAYTHKVWENFAHRRPLAESAAHGLLGMKWIH